LFPSGLRISDTGRHPLTDEVPFQLSDRSHNREQSLPKRAGRIHILLIADELNAQSTKLLQSSEQVLGGTGEAVKPPHDHRINLSRTDYLSQEVRASDKPENSMKIMDLPGWVPQKGGLRLVSAVSPSAEEVMIEDVLRVMDERVMFTCVFRGTSAGYNFRVSDRKVAEKVAAILRDNERRTLISIGTIELPPDKD